MRTTYVKITIKTNYIDKNHNIMKRFTSIRYIGSQNIKEFKFKSQKDITGEILIKNIDPNLYTKVKIKTNLRILYYNMQILEIAQDSASLRGTYNCPQQ